MRTVYSVGKRVSVFLPFLILFLLVFAISACGATSATSTGGSGSGAIGSGSTVPSMPIRGYGDPEGCPSSIVVNTASVKANVTVKLADTNSTIIAHNGDVIEIRLPFGHRWGGPTTSQGLLTLQGPAGYAWKADSVCIWHFVAKGTGKARLTFSGQALCKAGQMCPMYILAATFNITVK